jgi:hypothetical protein
MLHFTSAEELSDVIIATRSAMSAGRPLDQSYQATTSLAQARKEFRKSRKEKWAISVKGKSKTVEIR